MLDPTDMQAAAAKVSEACGHYEAQRLSLADTGSGVPLLGGYGKTGGYMKGLYQFTIVFQEVLAEFLEDEQKFVAFLIGFRDRIEQSAGLYRETELRNQNRFTRISGILDGKGR